MTCDAQPLRFHYGNVKEYCSLRLLKVLMNITYEGIGLNVGKNAWNDSLLDFLFPKEKGSCRRLGTFRFKEKMDKKYGKRNKDRAARCKNTLKEKMVPN